MKMKTFMATIRTDTPVTLIHPSFEPIDYDQAVEMRFPKKVKCFENGEVVIIANEFFRRITSISPDYDKGRLVVQVA